MQKAASLALFQDDSTRWAFILRKDAAVCGYNMDIKIAQTIR